MNGIWTHYFQGGPLDRRAFEANDYADYSWNNMVLWNSPGCPLDMPYVCTAFNHSLMNLRWEYTGDESVNGKVLP